MAVLRSSTAEIYPLLVHLYSEDGTVHGINLVNFTKENAVTVNKCYSSLDWVTFDLAHEVSMVFHGITLL